MKIFKILLPFIIIATVVLITVGNITLKSNVVKLQNENDALKNVISDFILKFTENDSEIKQLKNDNAELAIKLINRYAARVKVTAYHVGSGGINNNGDPKFTSTMTKPVPGRTCAISGELVELGWFGRELFVEGYGMYIANDRLSLKTEGKQIDLCVGSYKAAMRIGVNKNVLVALASRDFINEKINNKEN